MEMILDLFDALTYDGPVGKSSFNEGDDFAELSKLVCCGFRSDFRRTLFSLRLVR